MNKSNILYSIYNKSDDTDTRLYTYEKLVKSDKTDEAFSLFEKNLYYTIKEASIESDAISAGINIKICPIVISKYSVRLHTINEEINKYDNNFNDLKNISEKLHLLSCEENIIVNELMNSPCKYVYLKFNKSFINKKNEEVYRNLLTKEGFIVDIFKFNNMINSNGFEMKFNNGNVFNYYDLLNYISDDDIIVSTSVICNKNKSL